MPQVQAGRAFRAYSVVGGARRADGKQMISDTIVYHRKRRMAESEAARKHGPLSSTFVRLTVKSGRFVGSGRLGQGHADGPRTVDRQGRPANNSTHVQYTRLEVNGYTDTSGTPRYNQRLSLRRAQTVAAELVRDGVPRNAINIQGLGDTKLPVPTAAGVREPQNRRVEIIIR